MKTYLILILSGVIFCISCQTWDLERTDFPEVELLSIQQLSLSSIQVQAQLEGLLDGQVEELGFLWSSIDEIPAIDLVNTTKHNLGASFSNDLFSFQINELVINTPTYIRAYAVYDEKIIYSDVLGHESVTALTINNLGVEGVLRSRKAIASAQTLGLPQGKTIEKFGHCWSTTNQEPTIADFSLNGGSSVKDTTYTSELGNLEYGTTYYIRPFILVDNVEIYGTVETYTKGDYWERKKDIPDREFFNAITFSIGNKGYILNKISNLNTNYLQELWEYDVESDIWTYKLDFPGADRLRSVGWSTDNKGYIAYGERTSHLEGYANDIWEYDPNDISNGYDANGNPRGRFTQKTVSSPAQARTRATVYNIDGRIFYGFGVYNIYQDDEIIFTDFWEYIPNDTSNGFDSNGNPNGAWEKRADYPDIPRYGIGGMVYNGKGYAFFGAPDFSPNGQKLEVYAYNPLDDSWTKKQSAPENTSRSTPCVFLIDDNFYVGLGFDDETDFWQYAPSDTSNGLDANNEQMGAWKEATSFAPGYQNFASSIQIENKAFVFGGIQNGAFVMIPEMWEYFPDK